MRGGRRDDGDGAEGGRWERVRDLKCIQPPSQLGPDLRGIRRKALKTGERNNIICRNSRLLCAFW